MKTFRALVTGLAKKRGMSFWKILMKSGVSHAQFCRKKHNQPGIKTISRVAETLEMKKWQLMKLWEES